MAIIKVNASQGLSGALPAISGANLTGLTDNGKILKVTQANPSNYSTTLNYNFLISKNL